MTAKKTFWITAFWEIGGPTSPSRPTRQYPLLQTLSARSFRRSLVIRLQCLLARVSDIRVTGVCRANVNRMPRKGRCAMDIVKSCFRVDFRKTNWRHGTSLRGVCVHRQRLAIIPLSGFISQRPRHIACALCHHCKRQTKKEKKNCLV